MTAEYATAQYEQDMQRSLEVIRREKDFALWCEEVAHENYGVFYPQMRERYLHIANLCITSVQSELNWMARLKKQWQNQEGYYGMLYKAGSVTN